jgi:hypothetical protein
VAFSLIIRSQFGFPHNVARETGGIAAMRKLSGVLFWVLGGFAGIRILFAYIDPNTGGMIFQLLAVIFASLTGTLLFFSRQIRVTTARIRRFLSGSSANSAASDSAEPAAGKLQDQDQGNNP